MTYWIIKTQSHQHKVKDGDEIVVDRLAAKEGESIELDQVLLEVDGQKVTIGTPTTGKKLSATVLEHLRGKKIRVATYKSKSRYRRVKGHRQDLTRLKISASAAKKATPAKKPADPKTKAAAKAK